VPIKRIDVLIYAETAAQTLVLKPKYVE